LLENGGGEYGKTSTGDIDIYIHTACRLPSFIFNTIMGFSGDFA